MVEVAFSDLEPVNRLELSWKRGDKILPIFDLASCCSHPMRFYLRSSIVMIVTNDGSALVKVILPLEERKLDFMMLGG